MATVNESGTVALAPANDVNAARWRRAIPHDVSWLLCVVAKQGFVWSDGKLRAEHGTLNDDDVTVPIAFMGTGIAATVSQQRIRTVDIAPTLAAYLGIRPTEKLDGRALPGIVGRAGVPAAEGNLSALHAVAVDRARSLRAP